MTGAECIGGEESPASTCGSLWDSQEDVGAEPAEFSLIRRFLKRFLKKRNAPKNLQPSPEPEPENSDMNEKCRSLQSSYDSQSSDQSNQLRPNFSSTKQLHELEEDDSDF
ncbi:hypothetical protein FQA47_016036 [Oryzias melastigma]|uniref:Uncharacterized protein n=1 Tax=Oryzias melastigma TaxID=30732 RepID=A0A834FMY3_ORYME|nr:hypothetical protein FQA47_016036 [Oryzias melastigma]